MNKKLWNIRNYRTEDFEDYAQLHIYTESQDQSGRRVSRQLISEQLGHPSFEPESDVFVAEANQNLIGCVSVFLEPGIGRALLDGLVHPLYRRKGIATDLFGHAVGHARSAGIKAAQICIPETNLAAKKTLLQLGLRFFRHFFGYKLDLCNIYLPDVTPGKYIFCSLEPGAEEKLTTLQNRSFADTWGFNANTRDEIAYRINSSSCTPENIIMVYLEDRPVAYCWTRIHQEANSSLSGSKGEIHMLGVDPDFRNQSIGRNVLSAGLSYLKLKGVCTVELMADSETPGPLALYESIGFKKYMRSEWYEKKL